MVTRDGAACKIGVTSNADARRNGNFQYFTAHSYIAGSRVHEQRIHRYFAEYQLECESKSQELFEIRGELAEYLDWLGTRAFAVSLENIDDAYECPQMWPWSDWKNEAEHLREGTQQSLLLNSDCLVPGVRKPLSYSNKILATIRSDSDEWYTPPLYIQAAREVLGAIDLDPASCPLANLIVKATAIYTRNEDGLKYDWHGRVWLNPPYGNEKDRFVDHLLEDYQAERVQSAIVCLNAHATDTRWFQQLWEFPICITHHRVRFLGGSNKKKDTNPTDGAPTTGTAFVYVGPERDLFAKVFSRFGPVVTSVVPASTTADEFRRLQRKGTDWETP